MKCLLMVTFLTRILEMPVRILPEAQAVLRIDVVSSLLPHK